MKNKFQIKIKENKKNNRTVRFVLKRAVGNYSSAKEIAEKLMKYLDMSVEERNLVRYVLRQKYVKNSKRENNGKNNTKEKDNRSDSNRKAKSRYFLL